MRKELLAMFNDIIKTAPTDNPIQWCIHVRNEGKTVEATDSRRALRVQFAEFTGYTDGLYHIAKVGKDLQLMPAVTEGRYPDIDRVMSGQQVRDFPFKFKYENYKKQMVVGEPKYLSSYVIAVFGAWQGMAEDPAGVSFFNIDYLSGILTQWIKIAESAELRFISKSYPVTIHGDIGEDIIDYILMPCSMK